MKDFVFVTGNLHKVRWLEAFLGQKVEHHKLDLTEIQSLDGSEVTYHKTLEAYQKLKRPVLIDDVSLVIHAMGGLPGPFIKFFVEEIGLDGICKMTDGFDDRSATVRVLYGWYDGKDFKEFEGLSRGQISDKPRGEFGHGFDPIFIREGASKTHGQMTEAEYTDAHPRHKAVKKLKEFLQK